MISKKKKEVFYIIFLFLFSTTFNQYYGFLGINPIDSFFSFNSGYEILNGFYPFKDYWTITGPFIAFIQALFFKIFNVSWFSYVLHASIFNFIFAGSLFYTLYKFKLNTHYCFFYSLLIAMLAYPSAGTPYVDHHASYLSVIGLFCFILGLKTDSKIYWFILPIILGISFLTKQTPTGHFFIIITFLTAIYFYINFELKSIILLILGSITIIFIFLITLYITKIPLFAFFEQYIQFPLSIGENRLDFLFPLEFKRVVLRFKLIHFFLLILIFIVIREIKRNNKFIKDNDFLIIVSLISSSLALIAHQLMTINGLFIYFIIPILAGFAHIFYFKYLKKGNYFFYIMILLCFFSTIHYVKKYVHSRDFSDLAKVDLNKAIDAKLIDKKFNGLKWITPLYPNDPLDELEKLNEVLDIISSDSKNKAIITDYQFISVQLSMYDNSPNQVWFINHILNQDEKSKFFRIYKKFFLDKLKENKVEIIYVVKPLWGGNEVFLKALNNNCVKKNKITEILDGYLLEQCVELNN